MLKIGHEVVRPSKIIGGNDVVIPIPEELETVPGIPMNQREVDWYAREWWHYWGYKQSRLFSRFIYRNDVSRKVA